MEQHHIIADFSTSDAWIILSPIEASIKRKIEAVGTPLKEWDIQINYGIKTGCNDAFIIDTAKRDEILANCESEEERQRTEALIRPILRGKDIKRYSYNWAGRWLINTHNGIRGKLPRIDIQEYPAVKKHLDFYWHEISKRADQGDTPYNLRSCAYLEDFDKPKIIWKIIGCNINFCFDEQKILCNNAVNIMTGDRQKLIQFIGLMNSTLFDWYLKLTTEAEVQGEGIQLYVSTLNSTPLKLNFEDDFAECVYKRINGSISDLDLDRAVCKAYGLTSEERLFILGVS